MLVTRSGRPASQNEFELRSFIDLLRSRGVTRYMEVGARHGDTFFAVMRALPRGSVGVAIDMPGALWGTAKSQTPLLTAVSELRCMGYDAHVVFGDSKSVDVIARAAELAPYDAMLIDGDHTLDGVTADWRAYGSMAPVVAFHDIVGTGCAEKVHGNAVEVPVFWQGLRTQHEHVEFVDAGSRMGIGVVTK